VTGIFTLIGGPLDGSQIYLENTPAFPFYCGSRQLKYALAPDWAFVMYSETPVAHMKHRYAFDCGRYIYEPDIKAGSPLCRMPSDDEGES
jgi:hypothetical protein